MSGWIHQIPVTVGVFEAQASGRFCIACSPTSTRPRQGGVWVGALTRREAGLKSSFQVCGAYTKDINACRYTHAMCCAGTASCGAVCTSLSFKGAEVEGESCAGVSEHVCSDHNAGTSVLVANCGCISVALLETTWDKCRAPRTRPGSLAKSSNSGSLMHRILAKVGTLKWFKSLILTLYNTNLCVLLYSCDPHRELCKRVQCRIPLHRSAAQRPPLLRTFRTRRQGPGVCIASTFSWIADCGPGAVLSRAWEFHVTRVSSARHERYLSATHPHSGTCSFSVAPFYGCSRVCVLHPLVRICHGHL